MKQSLRHEIREALITKPKGEWVLDYKPMTATLSKSGIEMEPVSQSEFYTTELRFGTKVVVPGQIQTGEKVAFANERTMPMIMDGLYGGVRREVLDILSMAYERGADVAVCEALHKLQEELR